MKSFNNSARNARNLNLPYAHRRSSARSCLLRLAWLSGQPRSAVAACFTARLGFDALMPTTEEELRALLDAMETTRNRILEQVRAFDRRRLREKWRNHRHPKAAELTALFKVKAALLCGSGLPGQVAEENQDVYRPGTQATFQSGNIGDAL